MIFFNIVNNTGDNITFYQAPYCKDTACPAMPVLVQPGSQRFDFAFTGSKPEVHLFVTWYHCGPTTPLHNPICLTYKYDIAMRGTSPTSTCVAAGKCFPDPFVSAQSVSGPTGFIQVDNTGTWIDQPTAVDDHCAYRGTFTFLPNNS